MSKKDTVTKAFMRENAVFADAFNYRIFNGKKVIQPERLREVLGCIKYSKDKEKLSSFIRNNTRMTLELNAARVIQAITNVTLDLSEETEEVDMCKAIDDMMQDSRAEGLAEGMEKGKAEGICVIFVIILLHPPCFIFPIDTATRPKTAQFYSLRADCLSYA